MVPVWCWGGQPEQVEAVRLTGRSSLLPSSAAEGFEGQGGAGTCGAESSPAERLGQLLSLASAFVVFRHTAVREIMVKATVAKREVSHPQMTRAGYNTALKGMNRSKAGSTN